MVSGEDLAHLIPMVSICQGMSTLVKQEHMLSISLDWISINTPQDGLSVHRYSGSSIAVSQCGIMELCCTSATKREPVFLTTNFHQEGEEKKK